MDRVSAAGWQIVQRPGGLDVLLAQPHEVDDRAWVTRLHAALSAHGVARPAVRIREVTAIPRTALGKAPLITTADTERWVNPSAHVVCYPRGVYKYTPWGYTGGGRGGGHGGLHRG